MDQLLRAELWLQNPRLLGRVPIAIGIFYYTDNSASQQLLATRPRSPPIFPTYRNPSLPRPFLKPFAQLNCGPIALLRMLTSLAVDV